MKRFALSLALLAVIASASLWEESASRPVKISVWGGMFLVCVGILIEPVLRRRKEGQSWNDALAGGSKLMTGSVWLDGALFALIILALSGAVFALFHWV